MKRTFLLTFLLAMVLLSMPVSASGEYASFDALREAWYSAAEQDPAQYGWYPDGVCGIWLDRGVNIGITGDARGEAAKAAILDAVQQNENLHFVTQAHTQRELMTIMRTVSEESLGKVEGVCVLVLNEPANCVEIGISDETPAPELQQFMNDCTARWGDAVLFTASGSVTFSDSSLGGTPYMEIGVSNAPPIAAVSGKQRAGLGTQIAAAGVLLLLAGGLFLRRRQLAAQTVSGTVAAVYTRTDVVHLLRDTAEDAPPAVKEKLWAQIEKMRNAECGMRNGR